LDHDGRSDVAGTLQQAVRQADDRYRALKSTMDDTEQRLSDIMQKKINFDSNRKTTLTWLHELDKELKSIEASPVSQLEDSSTMEVPLIYWLMHLQRPHFKMPLTCLWLSLLPSINSKMSDIVLSKNY